MAEHVPTDKKQLIDSVTQNITELQKSIDRYRCQVESLLGQEVNDGRVRELLAGCPTLNREARLTAAIKETIDVLEESRKALKSKTLERLRKRLLQVLIDQD
jgi:DNA repair ATPase RecN